MPALQTCLPTFSFKFFSRTPLAAAAAAAAVGGGGGGAAALVGAAASAAIVGAAAVGVAAVCRCYAEAEGRSQKPAR